MPLNVITGNSGNNVLKGTAGSDDIYGFRGADKLTGGGGTDYFNFAINESKASVGQADTITDWNHRQDYIDSSIAGTAGSYAEVFSPGGIFFGVNNISQARSLVENSNALSANDHVFVYNGRDGYLLSDLNHNGTFETGVVLLGAGSASDMTWSDII